MTRALTAAWLVAVVSVSCNPYRNSDELPPARCRSDRDCDDGRTCSGGICALTGWVTGRIQYAHPPRARPGVLELAVHRAEEIGIHYVKPGGGSLGKQERVRTNHFRFVSLPTGRLLVVARCRSNGRLAGRRGFVVKGGQGYLPAMGAQREHIVNLPVNLDYCGR